MANWQGPQPLPQKHKGVKIIGLGCVGVLVIMAVIGIADSGDSNTHLPNISATQTSASASPSSGTQNITDLAFDYVWYNYTDNQKDEMCLALTVYGKQEAAQEMETGAGANASTIDWNHMADLMEQACNTR